MSFLELEQLTKYFGRSPAVDHISLSVDQGEFLTLLGPSGCGKTTILRMIAGFETPDAGTIRLDNVDITDQAANKRPMGMVFQSYALFPHMTAEQNIAFGLSIKHQPKNAIKQRCIALLELVGLSDKGRSYPHQLSGGQQQRIAIARALAVEPKVLLLDEPLSALDAKVRISLRNEIRRIQQQLKITAIYVTHNQEEALSISDRIAVMAKGKIEQLDNPEQIYSNPRTVFTATFVGSSNRFDAVVTSASEGRCQVKNEEMRIAPTPDLHDGDSVLILVRPEMMAIHDSQDLTLHNQQEINTINGTIQLRTFLGPLTRFMVQTQDGTLLTTDIPSQQASDFYVAQNVVLSFLPKACQALPLESTKQEDVRVSI
jgi:putative spermidine/putrescine transport system ATP-binding protein